MALIKCGECQREVSDKATNCPQCGAPIASVSEVKAAGVQISTVQETSKKFKLQILVSILLICIGVVWIIGASQGPEGDSSAGMAVLVTIAGLFWFMITRVRIWWHHK